MTISPHTYLYVDVHHVEFVVGWFPNHAQGQYRVIITRRSSPTKQTRSPLDDPQMRDTTYEQVWSDEATPSHHDECVPLSKCIRNQSTKVYSYWRSHSYWSDASSSKQSDNRVRARPI